MAKKILLWGTGRMTGRLLDEVDFVGRGLEIIGYVDNDASLSVYRGGTSVYKPAELSGLEFDAVIVPILQSVEVHEQVQELGLDESKFIYYYLNTIRQDMNKDYRLVADILGEETAEKIRHRTTEIRLPDDYILQRPLEGVRKWSNDKFRFDFVRMKTLEFIVTEIIERSITGNIAELGVFRGEFAQYLNYAFPDRKLYLFDTFEGFREEEAKEEQAAGNIGESETSAYANTNIERVMDIMPFSDRIVVKQGLFPESLDGLEDEFAFVSLDVDFEQSIYDGLCYFYPRLNNGGYIMLHDYNSYLHGVKKAVDRFEKEQGRIVRVPIPDAAGSLIIEKIN